MMAEKERKIMQFLDPNHPFFRKAATRWATALVPLVWGGVELATGHPGWGALFLAAGAYALWALIIRPRAGR